MFPSSELDRIGKQAYKGSEIGTELKEGEVCKSHYHRRGK